MSTCSVDGCTSALVARRLCGKHYQRLIRCGTTNSNPHRAERRPSILKPCAFCGKQFLSKQSKADATYCSQQCLADARRTTPRNDPRPCVICGITFTPSRHRGDARFCSKSCIGKHPPNRERAMRLIAAASKRSADKLRGTGTRGYVKRGGRHEHRVVAEQMLGRPLKRGEVVHHVDENKHNNDPSNLRVMTQAEHMRAHGLGVKGMALTWKPWTKRGRK